MSWSGEIRETVLHTHPRSRIARKYLEIARKVNGELVVERVGFLCRVLNGDE